MVVKEAVKSELYGQDKAQWPRDTSHHSQIISRRELSNQFGRDRISDRLLARYDENMCMNESTPNATQATLVGLNFYFRVREIDLVLESGSHARSTYYQSMTSHHCGVGSNSGLRRSLLAQCGAETSSSTDQYSLVSTKIMHRCQVQPC